MAALAAIAGRPCLITRIEEQNSELLIVEPMEFISSRSVYRRGRMAGFGINITKANSVSHAASYSGGVQRDHV